MRLKNAILLLFLTLLLALLAGCAAPPAATPASPPNGEAISSTPTPRADLTPASAPTAISTPTPNPNPTPSPTPTPTPAMPKATFSPKLQKVAENAVAILVEHLNVSPDEVTIEGIQRVTWRNGALGCPQPGMMYTQALVEGYLVKARVAGEEREVHMDERGRGVVCPSSDKDSDVRK